MIYTKDFSIIIPHRDSVQYLPTLFSSIPDSDGIEIIIVDNSPEPISKDSIGVDREFQLLYSSPSRGAGGARNVGVENAHGKWLLFLDADDYFAEGAFDVFYSKLNTDADIVYTGMGGVYMDTGEPSSRGDYYAALVKDYISGKKTEDDLRFGFLSPCCKMVSHDLVVRHEILFDEIRASNDNYFSTVSGYYAAKIEAVDFVTYIATVSRGTLTQRKDYEVIKARLYAVLHCNEFLKKVNKKKYQRSVMFALYECRHLGFNAFIEFCGMIIKFHQNPFIHCERWFSTFLADRENNKNNSRYITR